MMRIDWVGMMSSRGASVASRGDALIQGAMRVCLPSATGLRGSVSVRAILAVLVSCAAPSAGRAETMAGALSKAYSFSPDLGQVRAAGRAADEGVPRAASGFRPVISATASGGVLNNRTDSPANVGIAGSQTIQTLTYPRSLGLSVTQTIYNGDRTSNSVRQAESQAFQSREQVRLTELNVLNAAAAAYMNMLRDAALLELNQNNVRVLEEQLRQSRARLNFGEITRTDVAQSEAALAQGQANLFISRGNLQTSGAVYRQLIGEPPKALAPARPLESLLPRSLPAAIETAQREHPQIQAALHAADAAELGIRVQESALLPTVSIQGNISQSWDAQTQPRQTILQYSAIGSLSVPLYDGGVASATVRQAKELYSQARLQADLQRETVFAGVTSAWTALQTTRANIRSYQALIRANETALDGVRQEAKLGQRTTLDVLNAQQTLLNSRVNLIGAQRDLVVQSYALVAATGQLSASYLGLKVEIYDPAAHFDQVKDKAFGLRTPDGR